MSLTPSMLSTRTRVSAGMASPEPLRADHTLPSTFTVPRARTLSMGSSTRPSAPRSRSALVATVRLLTYFRAMDRVPNTVRPVTIRKAANCSSTLP